MCAPSIKDSVCAAQREEGWEFVLSASQTRHNKEGTHLNHLLFDSVQIYDVRCLMVDAGDLS